MAINATPGSPTADSYVDVTESDSYFFGSKATTWAALSISAKEALLKEATRLLDQFFDWSGDIELDSTQSLRWPRVGAYDADRRLIASNVVPKAVKQGTIEWAYQLNASGGFTVSSNSLDVIKVGPIRLDFKDGANESSFPKMVIDIVSSVGSLKSVSTSSVGQAKLVRT